MMHHDHAHGSICRRPSFHVSTPAYCVKRWVNKEVQPLHHNNANASHRQSTSLDGFKLVSCDPT